MRKKQPELWSVDASGTTTKLGGYPPPPAAVQNYTPALLAPDDSLYGDGTSAANFQIGVLSRVTIDGEGEVVYSESEKSDLDVVALITGP